MSSNENIKPKSTPEHPIAFFSAEYAIENSLPIYAGGLGVLSGDMVLEAGSEGIAEVAFGTMYAYGFDTVGDTSKRLDPLAAGFELIKGTDGDTMVAQIICNDRVVLVQAWQKYYGSARLILLDTDNPWNTHEDRQLTDHLYNPNFVTQMCCEWVYGLGAVEFMKQLGITPSVYHVNEGHTSFVVLGLILDYLKTHPKSTLKQAQSEIRKKLVASKHTILAGAGLFIDRLVFKSIAGSALNEADFEAIFSLGRTLSHPEHFSTTKFIMDHARNVNGVSELHVAKEKAEHPSSRLIAITNGVYRGRWLAQNLQNSGTEMSDASLWKHHNNNRASLVSMINDTVGSQLDPRALTIIWARRIAVYKRPALLFHNISRLEELVNNDTNPVQFIIAGKANSGDDEAKRILSEILKFCKLPKLSGKVVYLPGYSVPTTKQLAAGADLWLNTPIRGQEACGTSGMKASLNGALQLSTSDGWIDEVTETFIGWKLPEENLEKVLYDTIEGGVAPLFYDRNQQDMPTQWVKQMRQTMALINERFSAKRMLNDYINKLYFP
ncbi:MAG: alpha-glucan family phosphorylase [Candidatus Saccharimonadia bacterium]